MTETAPTDDSGDARASSEREGAGGVSGEAEPARPGESAEAKPARSGESADDKPAETVSGDSVSGDSVSGGSVSGGSAPGTWVANSPEAFGEGAESPAQSPAGVPGPPAPPPAAWSDAPAGLPPGPHEAGPRVPPGPSGPYPPPGYPGYPSGPYPGGYPAVGQAPPNYPVHQFGGSRPTNAMAIISLVLGILGLVLFFGVASIPAVIVGHIARKQIRERDENGDGLALAGLILGWIGTGLLLLFIGFLVVVFGLAAAGSVGH